jgi:hypothetical protein
MKKLRDIGVTQDHLVKSSRPLSSPVISHVFTLLEACMNREYSNGMASKRMSCSNSWLLLRLSKGQRVLIDTSQIPREVWVIRRSELDDACKSIHTRRQH